MTVGTHIITLKRGEFTERTLYKVEQGDRLLFKLHSSIVGLDAKVFSNIPPDASKDFNRHEYYELPWVYSGGDQTLSEVDGHAEVVVTLSGSFRYYSAIASSSYKDEVCAGYFVVDPILKINPSSDKTMPLEAVCMQTVTTKQLGPVEEWLDRLRTTYETKYNVVHFTPVQHLGASNSAYSIKDQLKVDPRYFSSKNYANDGWTAVEGVVQHMRKEWGMFSITDVVLNHTSYDSPWIHEHPEAGYNLVNSPHLKPAFVLDRLLWQLTLDVNAGKYAKKGVLPTPVTSETLEILRNVFISEVLPKHKIAEFYLADVDTLVSEFRAKLKGLLDAPGRLPGDVAVQLVQDPKYNLFGCTVDLEAAVAKFYFQRPQKNYSELVEAAVSDFEAHVTRLNKEKKERIQGFLLDGVGNCVANAGYVFLDPNGPKWDKIAEETPIVWRYFSEHPYQTMTTTEEMAAIDEPEVACHFKACNGWIMCDDPLRNFAEPGSMVYLKRELIVWGDSIKLRFGQCREDSPYLWDRVEKYCAKTAEMFDGIRLDNCHSTPLHVAEFAVDTCRRVKKDFYVMAELFTGREDLDMVFVNRLGITSLVREAMSAYNCRELGRQVHRYGGRPVGDFYLPSSTPRPLTPSLPHALFMDYTHDNQPSAVQKRHPVDLLASAAAVAMGGYGTGSSRGYDEMVPHYIDIVNEKRLYPKWNEDVSGKGDKSVPPTVGMRSGMIRGKRLVNELHQMMSSSGDNDTASSFDQVYVDQVTDDVITVTRHNSRTHESVIAAIRTAFDPSVDTEQPAEAHSHQVTCLNIPGQITEIILEASTVLSSEKDSGTLNLKNFTRDLKVINGLNQWRVLSKRNIQVGESEMVKVKDKEGDASQGCKVEFKSFKPGSVVVFRVSLDLNVNLAMQKVQKLISEIDPAFFDHEAPASKTDHSKDTPLHPFDFSALSLVDMNALLYRCGAEESSHGMGLGPYNLPSYGDLKYCGIAGVKFVLDEAVAGGDLGHPLCENVRQGDWLMDYSVNRLKMQPNVKQVGEWLEPVVKEMKKLPMYLKPAYLQCLVTAIYNACVKQIMIKLNQPNEDIGSLKCKLLLGSVQLTGVCKTAALAPVLLDNMKASFDYVHKLQSDVPSLAAGLPHFSEGIWRNWGRDTFIALRGLLIIPGRIKEARYIILSYASTMRHGLIPNLLGGGEVSRYNCRDAVWWWLNSIRHLCQAMTTEEARKLLEEKVARIYRHDSALYERMSTEHEFHSLADIIQEGLQKHAQGIRFVERNAGPQIDSNMCKPGFTVEVSVDPATGFTLGGNKYNCGTWMDKMGSSDRAGNRGTPATPRDGASVELQGLCYACVKWLGELNKKKMYAYEGVKIKDGSLLKFSNWAERLGASFDCHFFVGASPDERYNDLSLVNKKNIYKDTLGSQNPWTDYQLRPNYAIAIAEALEMCDLENAWRALETIQKVLLGPLGMKTLDPSDWKYNGVYDNDRDDENFDLAKGFNYHNGPEWVWLTGFFLRAKLAVSRKLKREVRETEQLISQHLTRMSEHIHNSPWRGVTELTNVNGNICSFSSPTQAWSFSTALELIHELNQK
ncbi:glycogen debranching enzyme-like [Symsagittifera roscoffensis]|uniref:glycogen debranching enzyme-like n=1 Tax=Symsagittifera roscoffensis TaxID=84072 RepID=UPI00307C9F48